MHAWAKIVRDRRVVRPRRVLLWRVDEDMQRRERRAVGLHGQLARPRWSSETDGSAFDAGRDPMPERPHHDGAEWAMRGGVGQPDGDSHGAGAVEVTECRRAGRGRFRRIGVDRSTRVLHRRPHCAGIDEQRPAIHFNLVQRRGHHIGRCGMQHRQVRGSAHGQQQREHARTTDLQHASSGQSTLVSVGI